MAYLVIGRSSRTAAIERALRAADPDAPLLRVTPARALAPLRADRWAGIILIDDLAAPAGLLARCLNVGAPLLIADPGGLRHLDTDTLTAAEPGAHARVTIGLVGPSSAGIAALSLEVARLDVPAGALAVSLDLQVPADGGPTAFDSALLDGGVTLAHLAAWPTRVTAVATAIAPAPTVGAQTTALLATFLAPPAATAGLTLMRTPAAAARRLRVAAPHASLLLREDARGGLLELDAGDEPLALAAGAESAPPDVVRRSHVPRSDPDRSIVARFLRRRAQGGADDLATLINGLTLSAALRRSAQRHGQIQNVVYRADIHESPRLQLLPGGRRGAPRRGARPPLTVVR